MQSPVLPKPGDLIGRKYRIVSSIGAGGMGVVFEAVHVETDAPVALKWLSPELSSSPEAVERFKIEARAMGRIRHPNVVAVHDLGEHETSLYLVMELLRGSSLRQHLSRGPMPLAEALRVLFPVMRGVAAAHAVKVLHRDLKPDNIFLAESPDGLDPVPKVLDFGIAKLCSESERTSSVSAKTAMIGTYQYMPFEQLHGRKDLDDRVDVYALGVVLYCMLTGRLPFEADNPVDLALQMLQSQPKPLTAHQPQLPAALAEVVAKALARDRDQRFASVDQLAIALEAFAQGLRYRGPQAAAPSVGFTPTAPEPSKPASVLPTPFVVGKGSSAPTPVAKRPPAARAPSRVLLWAGLAAAGVVGGVWAVAATRGGSAVVRAPAPPPAPSRERDTALQATKPAAALPVTHEDAAASHVEEWDSPAPSVVEAIEPGPAPTPTGPADAPSTGEATPVHAGRPPARNSGRDSSAAGARSERTAAAKVSTPEPSAPTKPAVPPASPHRPAFQPSQELDMTELPTPSWARDPASKRPKSK